MTMEEVNQWASTAKKNEKLLYYKGFFAEDAFNNFEMKEFSKNILDFEKKNVSFILYQKKIKTGNENVQPIYEYYIKKIKGGNNDYIW